MADGGISSKADIGSLTAADDLLLITDVSDTTDSAQGTSKTADVAKLFDVDSVAATVRIALGVLTIAQVATRSSLRI